MEVLEVYGNDALARVFVARMRRGDPRSVVEFVESVQPPLSREEKWVIIVSSMFGCPIGCMMCDAGGSYAGPLTSQEILAQIDECVIRRYPDHRVPSKKFKVQFSRMGEPSLNPAVLEALRALPDRFDAPGLIVSLSTTAPARAHGFFEKLLHIKQEMYRNGRFQLQFSIHTTDLEKRRALIPAATWTFEQIAEYGERFFEPRHGDRKIVLNFAPLIDHPIDPSKLKEHFDPETFIVKLTPLNPTIRSMDQGMVSVLQHGRPETYKELVKALDEKGYEVILSLGEEEENRIGSNCGQYVQRMLSEGRRPMDAYDVQRYRGQI